MLRILIESDHFLKSVPVLLDPETPEEHRRAVADFFAHDMPDFLDWCEGFRKQVPGLFPAQVVFGEDQADFDAKLAEADLAIVFTSEIEAAGAKLAAPLPETLQLWAIYTAAIPAASRAPQAAREFLAALMAPGMRDRWQIGRAHV